MGFKQARIQAGKSIREVMEAMGVSDAAVYSWETGQYAPSTDKLVKLADLYGVTVDQLLREEVSDE